MNSKRVLIAGCGDLGTGVAEYFVAKGDQVYAVRRSGTVFPHKVRGVTGNLTELADEALPDVDLIVLIMTPSERSPAGYRAAYFDTAQRLTERYQSAQTPLLFVSSTSVYGQNKGQWIDQDTPPIGAQETAKILLETEQLLARALPSIALRCSGIYGPKRYRMLDKINAGEVWQANSWTNRVHRHDVVRALCHLAEKVLNGESLAGHYNVTDDTPVSMWEVKLCIAHLLGVAVNLPDDVAAFLPISGKRISNQALKETGFCFAYPSYVSGYEELVKAYLAEQSA
ncbi:NAD-dependent epimerase/dehydratase family protein [Marinomonas pollencensis]|uniref:Nucleoside-diphosphate-sugar epimerase n=1 Tax=Marinomonas pollencensis TaxID=491954 RepID=A0A3E0DP53_9GAMM|nr:NAD-dependent epimerase/dehydratase family protein [Marinomonas pollencensis]REG83929.1 nucleoside-diphosphate-sugar epimerase [Marinomonas pollencensis]